MTANTNQLKTSMNGMRDRIVQDAEYAHAELDKIIDVGEAAAKDAALKAKEMVANMLSHFEAFVQTAHVAADATPVRSGAAMPTAGSTLRQYAAEPVKMSGVPATPPGGPHNVAGPAVTHDDVGYRDHATGVDHAAPAATGEAPHSAADAGDEGSVQDGPVGDGVENRLTYDRE